ncbi:MAG TPA: hypothetical protein DET40_03350 [Lentisphaeria bacterium]|nr:MAG: hypothetical protein A2X45_22145 [Lentisphaerae bacterium GWF2_50_93]HCE42564.1 hypothetical protein [Lentisphaeria bacterium]
MNDRVKICMIGAGGHSSRNIYPCFPVLKNTEVSANADLNLGRAKDVAMKNGIPRSYADYHEMLDKERPDGVVVCVGPNFHAECAIELMDAGFHVCTEKPPAVSLKQCQQVIETQKRTGKICMTAFKKRFAPAGVKMKQVVESADFGNPSTISVFRTRDKGGNGIEDCLAYILDSGVHMFDLVAWLFGPASSVQAIRSEPTSVAVLVSFANGAVGTMLFPTTLSNRRIWEEITVTGSGGVFARMENSTEMIAFKKEQPIAAYKPEWCFASCDSSVEMGFIPELQAFVEAIRSGNKPESSVESVLPGMALLEATLESLKTGKNVSIS